MKTTWENKTQLKHVIKSWYNEVLVEIFNIKTVLYKNIKYKTAQQIRKRERKKNKGDALLYSSNIIGLIVLGSSECYKLKLCSSFNYYSLRVGLWKAIVDKLLTWLTYDRMFIRALWESPGITSGGNDALVVWVRVIWRIYRRTRRRNVEFVVQYVCSTYMSHEHQ